MCCEYKCLSSWIYLSWDCCVLLYWELSCFEHHGPGVCPRCYGVRDQGWIVQSCVSVSSVAGADIRYCRCSHLIPYAAHTPAASMQNVSASKRGTHERKRQIMQLIPFPVWMLTLFTSLHTSFANFMGLRLPESIHVKIVRTECTIEELPFSYFSFFSLSAVRKRLREDRKANTAQKLQQMKQKLNETERKRKRWLYWKPILAKIGFGTLILVGAYYCWKMYFQEHSL